MKPSVDDSERTDSTSAHPREPRRVSATDRSGRSDSPPLRIEDCKATVLHGAEFVSFDEFGPSGRLILQLRQGFLDAAVREALRDPDRFLDRPEKSGKLRKRRDQRRRLVGFQVIRIGERKLKLFVKLYRVRSLKDLFEELLFGKRAERSLRNGLEAERRGIPVPPHVGTSRPPVLDRWPSRSALAMLGLPKRRDVLDVLAAIRSDKQDCPIARRRFLRALGSFCGDVHRRGLAHGDLKAGNVFVLDEASPRFALIDLDRARLRQIDRTRFDWLDALDLYRMLQSLRRVTCHRDRLALVAAYRRIRGLSRSALRSLGFAITSRYI